MKTIRWLLPNGNLLSPVQFRFIHISAEEERKPWRTIEMDTNTTVRTSGREIFKCFFQPASLAAKLRLPNSPPSLLYPVSYSLHWRLEGFYTCFVEGIPGACSAGRIIFERRGSTGACPMHSPVAKSHSYSVPYWTWPWCIKTKADSISTSDRNGPGPEDLSSFSHFL